MDKQTYDYIAERAEILSKSGASKQETAAAAQAWLDAVNGADDAAIEAATAQLADYLEGRPHTIDETIAFCEGPAAGIFGQETADQMLTDTLARKEAGEKWCNCEACTAAVEILTACDRL